MTPDQREAYEERAAIMEFDGGLSREEAERQAMVRVRLETQREQEAAWKKKQCGSAE